MSGFKNIPGRPVTDPDNGLGADVVVDGDVNRLAVDATGTFTGTVQVEPPTDRRFLTTSVSAVPIAISFVGFDITGINIKSSQNSDGPIRLGEADLDTSTSYTILEPGEVWNAELNGTLSPVFVMFDTGTTTATVHVTALGNPTP